MTLIEMINAVQVELRLPKSATVINSPHAKLVQSWINKIQRFYMTELEWDELRYHGYFSTVAGTATYTITNSDGYEIDYIKDVWIHGYDPIKRITDGQFVDKRTTYYDIETSSSINGQPLYYRYYQRSATGLIVELLPTPDAVYQVNADFFVVPPKLTTDASTPLLKDDIIVEGALMLARKEQGTVTDQDIQDFIQLQAKGAKRFNKNRERQLAYRDI